MKLPKTLYTGYNLLKKSRAVSKKNTDEDALTFMQNVLNKAQPSTPDDLVMHRLVKGLYNENKYKFLNFVKNTNFECLVLWTESRAIVNTLGLRGVIYVKWTGPETLYELSPFQSGVGGMARGNTRTNEVEHPLVQRNRLLVEEPLVKEFNYLDIAKGEPKTQEASTDTSSDTAVEEAKESALTDSIVFGEQPSTNEWGAESE
jgi:hypothetical protein